MRQSDQADPHAPRQTRHPPRRLNPRSGSANRFGSAHRHGKTDHENRQHHHHLEHIIDKTRLPSVRGLVGGEQCCRVMEKLSPSIHGKAPSYRQCREKKNKDGSNGVSECMRVERCFILDCSSIFSCDIRRPLTASRELLDPL